MRNILEALNITPDGGAKKNPFDLSNYETFHQKGGQFNVVGVRDTVPDSDYVMSVDGVTRTLLCNTANFARMKENYYFIHVPLGLISRNAYMMQVQRKENYSALDMGIGQMPVFSLGKVVAECFRIAMYNNDKSDNDYGPDSDGWDSSYFDEHGFNIGCGAPLSEHTAVALAAAQSFAHKLDDLYPSVGRLGAYQCAWYHFFRNDIYNNDVPASCFNFDDVTIKSTQNEPNYKSDEVRGVYRFVVECCRLRYNPVKKDIFTASMPGTQWGAVSSVSLVTDLEFTTEPVTVTSDGANMTATSYSPARLGVNPQSLGNVHVLPPDANSGEYGRYVTEFAPSQGTLDGIYTPHDHAVTVPSNSLSIPAGTSLFDVLSLVEAQAIQKWRQKAMMAGNRTRDNWKAHYGVVPRHLQEHLPDFIGSVDNEIFVKEITSQANTLDAAQGDNNLGEIRGRGYGASDKHSFKFHSNDYGVLLLIHAIVPENTYSSFGLDRGNTLIFNTDFPQPEYNNIGLEVVPKYIGDVLSKDIVPSVEHEHTGGDNFLDVYNHGAYGYANRYFGHKQYPSKAHGLFNPSRLYRGVSVNDYGEPIFDPANVFGYADMQSFVLTRNDFISKIGFRIAAGGVTTYLQAMEMKLGKLYVNPHLFDSIFAISADNSLASDVFFSHVRFECKAMLPMPVVGLPKF